MESPKKGLHVGAVKEHGIRLFLLSAFLFVVCLVSYGILSSHPAEASYSGYEPRYQLNISQEFASSLPLLSTSPFNFSTQTVILDSHTHTSKSDGKLSTQQLLKYLKAQGYNAVIVTDHQSAQPGLDAVKVAEAEYPNGEMLVIPGMEYTSCRIHMNFYGVNETVKVPQAFPTDDQLREAIAKVHSLGGLVIVNHLPWSFSPEDGQGGATRLQRHPTRDQLREWGVDGFEVVAGDTLDYPTLQFCQQHNLVMMSGSDSHRPTGTFGWNILNLQGGEPRTAGSVLKALKERRHQILFKPEGLIPPPTGQGVVATPPQSQFFEPVRALGKLAKQTFRVNRGMYSFVNGEFCHPSTVESQPGIPFALLFWFLVCYVAWWLCHLAVTLALTRWRLKKKSVSASSVP
jgi:predicted metal-dependent phosphoesterase TrpH